MMISLNDYNLNDDKIEKVNELNEMENRLN